MKRWNWRSYAAGIASSALLLGLVTPALADVAGRMTQNQVNIIANGATISSAGQNYTLESGNEVPSSITFTDSSGRGTVYLPIRRVSQILGVEIGWDGDKNAVVIGESENSTTYQQGNIENHQPPIYYGRYPDILSIENVTNDITYYNEIEIDYPQFDIYSYNYMYQAKTFEDSKRYAKEYSDYLVTNGYSLIYDGVYSTSPTILGEPSHEYRLQTPDGRNIVRIRYHYTAYTGENLYYIDVDIEPVEITNWDDQSDDNIEENQGVEDEHNEVVKEEDSDVAFDRETVSEEDMLNYLNKNVPLTVSTPLGTYTFSFDVYKNSSRDAGIDFWITTDYPVGELVWYDFENSLDIDPDDLRETLDILQEYQKSVYDAAWECAPGAKMRGGFYSSAYRYPHIREGFFSTNVFSWKNYDPYFGNYEETNYTRFEWTPEYDDYIFD